MYDRKRCGLANALELACGLSVVGQGSKSQKLAQAFEFITKLRQQRSRALRNQQYYGSGNEEQNHFEENDPFVSEYCSYGVFNNFLCLQVTSVFAFVSVVVPPGEYETIGVL